VLVLLRAVLGMLACLVYCLVVPVVLPGRAWLC
jgi:hypothetical protein